MTYVHKITSSSLIGMRFLSLTFVVLKKKFGVQSKNLNFCKHSIWFLNKWYVDLLLTSAGMQQIWYQRLVKLVVQQTTYISRDSQLWQEHKSSWFTQNRYMLTHIIGRYGSRTRCSRDLTISGFQRMPTWLAFSLHLLDLFSFMLISSELFVRIGKMATNSSPTFLCHLLNNFIWKAKVSWLSLIVLSFITFPSQ